MTGLSTRLKLQLLALYFIWGFTWVVMRIASGHASASAFVMMRVLLSAVLLFPICLYRKKVMPPKQAMPWIAISGVLLMGIHHLFTQTGTGHLGSGLSSVIDYTMPLWVTVIAAFTIGEKLTMRKIIAVCLNLLGLVIFMRITDSGDTRYILLVLTAAVAWAVNNVIVRSKLKGYDAVMVTTWQLVFGSVFLILYNLIKRDFMFEMNAYSLGALFYTVIFTTALGFFLWNDLLSHLEASKASIAIMVVPVLGVLLGALFFREPLTVSNVFGFSMIIVGVLIALT